MSPGRPIIAVIFGGRSVEHDVSVLTGLQFLEALDLDRYEGLPVYVAPDGAWWTGQRLLKRSSYPLDAAAKTKLRPVTLPVGVVAASRPHLLAPKKGLIGASVQVMPFDLMVPAIHGSNGEDGSLQGLLDFARVPYAGCRPLGAAATMDKDFTKQVLGRLGVPVLPHATLTRPAPGEALTHDRLKTLLDARLPDWAFPLIVKPRTLGSSVGVARAQDMDALTAALLAAFRMDAAAVVEPFVTELVEYNVAVMRGSTGGARVSAIERPVREAAVLDFKGKYLAGGTAGPKLDEAPSEGMASLNRVIEPDELTPTQRATIVEAAHTAVDALQLAGSVRIDFLCDAATGRLWLNEINSVPGSFAYYLWQAADPPLSFTELTTAMIEEGFALAAAQGGDTDAGPGGATIFARA